MTFDIILPGLKRFAHEKIYPFVSDKWDDLMKKQSDEPSGVKEKRANTKKTKIINVFDYSQAM